MNPAAPRIRNKSPNIIALLSCSAESLRVKMLRTSAKTIAFKGSIDPATTEKQHPAERAQRATDRSSPMERTLNSPSMIHHSDWFIFKIRKNPTLGSSSFSFSFFSRAIWLDLNATAVEEACLLMRSALELVILTFLLSSTSEKVFVIAVGGNKRCE